MKARVVLFSLIAAYIAIVPPFTAYLHNRPVVNKVGYIPDADVLKVTIGDQKYLVAEWAVVKVMLYFGAMVGGNPNQLKLPPEYLNMGKTLGTAVKLDPYNMDAYYLAEAAFVWDVKGGAKEVNNMLLRGMKYRTWDYYLPFFAGFNAAYFLHDFRAAADYMKKAAELSGDPLFATLSARYFHEAGRTDLGIVFMNAMEKGAKDAKVRRAYHLRREALEAAKGIADAADKFKGAYHRNPSSVAELVERGFLVRVPKDPYGGQFYLTEKGTVESTSKFANGGKDR